MKKIIYSLIVFCVVLSAFFYKPIEKQLSFWLSSFIQEKVTETQKENFESLYKTNRNIPENIDLGAFWAGISAKDSGDLKKSISYLKKAYKADPENKEIKKQLYLLEGISGNMDSLVTLFNNDQQDEDLFFSTYIKVAVAIAESDYEKAKTLLKNNKTQMGEIFEAPLLAWTYAGLKDKKAALSSLEKMPKDDFSLNLKWYHSALILDYLGYTKEAESFYEKLANAKEFASWTMLVSGKEFFERQNKWDYQNSFYKKYKNTLKEAPLLADILSQVGMRPVKTPILGLSELFYSWGINTGERADLSAFISNIALFLNENHTFAKIWMAELAEKTKHYAYAHKIYDNLLKEAKDADIILYKKANLYITEKDYTSAVKVFKDLETRNKHNLMVVSMLAVSYDELGDCKKALPLLERTKKLLSRLGANSIKDINQRTATCYLKENNFKQFEKNLYEYLQTNPKDPDVLNQLSYEWLLRDINLEKAIVFLEQAKEASTNRPDILDSLALAYYKKGKYQEALVLAEKAVDSMGASSVANMHLGDIYKALGRKREAISQYEKALALNFDLTPEVEKELLERLK